MAYNNKNVEVTPLFRTQYRDLFAKEYEAMWNQLAFVTDEVARVRAVNSYMVSFTQALGMGELGAVSFDESLADQSAGFTTFVKTVTPAPSSGSDSKPAYNGGQQGGYNRSQGGYSKPAFSGNSTDGPSEKQLSTLNSFYSRKGNEEYRAMIDQFMMDFGKNSFEELTRKEISDIIGACFAKRNGQ